MATTTLDHNRQFSIGEWVQFDFEPYTAEPDSDDDALTGNLTPLQVMAFEKISSVSRYVLRDTKGNPHLLEFSENSCSLHSPGGIELESEAGDFPGVQMLSDQSVDLSGKKLPLGEWVQIYFPQEDDLNRIPLELVAVEEFSSQSIFRDQEFKPYFFEKISKVFTLYCPNSITKHWPESATPVLRELSEKRASLAKRSQMIFLGMSLLRKPIPLDIVRNIITSYL